MREAKCVGIVHVFIYSLYWETKTAPKVKFNPKYMKLIISIICLVTLTLKNVLRILEREVI